MFDHTCSAEITLINSGKVGFDFVALNMDPSLAKKPRPGVPIMVPHAVSKTILNFIISFLVGIKYQVLLSVCDVFSVNQNRSVRWVVYQIC